MCQDPFPARNPVALTAFAPRCHNGRMQGRSLYLGLGGCLALVALPADAYLDPASGSMFLSLILGGVAGLGVVVKLYWRKLLARFGAKKPEHGEPTA